MGLITANDFPNLRELYTAQLRYLLSTENQIVKALQKMIDHADDTQLKQAFQSHLQETEVHATRLQDLIAEVKDGGVVDKKDPISQRSSDPVRTSPKNPTQDRSVMPV
jgi:ferritin-like metal-binding protein YciE